MNFRHVGAALFLVMVLVVTLMSLPSSWGFDEESQTQDGQRLPSCGICHSLDTGASRLLATLTAPEHIALGDTFELNLTLDPSRVDSDEHNYGVFILDGATREYPGDHGWTILADPHNSSTPANYNRIDGVEQAGSYIWTLQESSGELGLRTLSAWVNYDNGGDDSKASYVLVSVEINVQASLDADIQVPGDGFFHVYEPVNLTAFTTMENVISYQWDLDDAVDLDGNGNYTDDPDEFGAQVTHKYRFDRQVTVTLNVTNDEKTALGQRTLTIRDYSLYIEGLLHKSCYTCHDNPGLDKKLNFYGLDFQAHEQHRIDPLAVIEALNESDSDGDTFSNAEELLKGTRPGDPSDFPIVGVQWIAPQPTVFVISQVIDFQATGKDEAPYRWAFGDGTFQDGKRVTHAYHVAGTYRVILSYNNTQIDRELTIIDPSALFPAPINNCLTCHNQPDGTGGFNPYGEAYRSEYGSLIDPWGAIEAIDHLDSDGDNVTNGVEIASGHYPGNASSVPLPDLVVRSIWMSPEVPHAGETITLYVKVVNEGYFDALNTTLELRLNHERVLTQGRLNFYSGVPVIIPYSWEAQQGVGQRLQIFIDTEDTVFETNENNNDGKFIFTVMAQDTEAGVPGLDLALVVLTLGLLSLARRYRP